MKSKFTPLQEAKKTKPKEKPKETQPVKKGVPPKKK